MSAVTASLDLPVADAALAESVRVGLAAVERRLAEAVQQNDKLADDASRHLIEAGGKRVRPMLTLLAGFLADGARAEVIEAAVVVELTHLATLYHDDVMDSAPVRRGAPAAHQVWGNTVAILICSKVGCFNEKTKVAVSADENPCAARDRDSASRNSRTGA